MIQILIRNLCFHPGDRISHWVDSIGDYENYPCLENDSPIQLWLVLNVYIDSYSLYQYIFLLFYVDILSTFRLSSSMYFLCPCQRQGRMEKPELKFDKLNTVFPGIVSVETILF